MAGGSQAWLVTTTVMIFVRLSIHGYIYCYEQMDDNKTKWQEQT
jgi:hypothetical protein